MTLKRFKQIKRYLHISHPDEDKENKKQWWYKLDPLASYFQEAAEKYYQPGSNISIDETMIRCFGRTKHTIKMPNKPIQQGYKIFALAEHSYIWTFTWSSRL
jgi:Transposase IS4